MAGGGGGGTQQIMWATSKILTHIYYMVNHRKQCVWERYVTYSQHTHTLSQFQILYSKTSKTVCIGYIIMLYTLSISTQSIPVRLSYICRVTKYKSLCNYNLYLTSILDFQPLGCVCVSLSPGISIVWYVFRLASAYYNPGFLTSSWGINVPILQNQVKNISVGKDRSSPAISELIWFSIE